MDGAQLIEYALQKFNDEKYDEALEAFILAYSRGYEQEWILENIYACYVTGNEPVFKAQFEKYGANLDIKYDECSLDFIPCREGEYYVFDKDEKIFFGKISMEEIETTEADEIVKQHEFSALAFEMDGNWQREQYRHILAEAINRKIYAVCTDMKKAVSILKIPELEPYKKNIFMFPDYKKFQEYFHSHTSAYLPKIVYGDNDKLNEIIAIEHEYRLTPEGRNTDNVMLTIAIPTAHRGNLLLKRLDNLLRMPYDAEIEITVSKNGMGYYEEDYEKAGKIKDARLIYYDHKKDLICYHNWHYAAEMAHGRFVMFVSDEDDVDLDAIDHYLKFYDEHPEVSVIRADLNGGEYGVKERLYKKRGKQAFLCGFLVHNYLSGLIVRRDAFLEADLMSLDQFKDNEFYKIYPHEWWVAMLCRKGEFVFEPVTLIWAGKEAEESKGTSIPVHSTYKSRLDQCSAQAEFLDFYCGQDMEFKFEALKKMFFNLERLYILVRRFNFDADNFVFWVDEFVKKCLEIIDSEVSEPDKIDILQGQIYSSASCMLKEHISIIQNNR